MIQNVTSTTWKSQILRRWHLHENEQNKRQTLWTRINVQDKTDLVYSEVKVNTNLDTFMPQVSAA